MVVSFLVFLPEFCQAFWWLCICTGTKGFSFGLKAWFWLLFTVEPCQFDIYQAKPNRALSPKGLGRVRYMNRFSPLIAGQNSELTFPFLYMVTFHSLLQCERYQANTGEREEKKTLEGYDGRKDRRTLNERRYGEDTR